MYGGWLIGADLTDVNLTGDNLADTRFDGVGFTGAKTVPAKYLKD